MLKEMPQVMPLRKGMCVLILILMEHAQRDKMEKTKMKPIEVVLILILMEHAQRVKEREPRKETLTRLNPYFNGTCSKR